MPVDPNQARAALTLFGRRKPAKAEHIAVEHIATRKSPSSNDHPGKSTYSGTAAPQGFHADWESLAVFTEEGPEPIPLIEEPGFRAVLVSLTAGQWIPRHAEATAVYYFLKGSGSMGVEHNVFAIQPGAIVVASEGAQRGIEAQTDVVFLAALGQYPADHAA